MSNPYDTRPISAEIRNFLERADIYRRMTVQPVLFLEFSDVGSMRKTLMDILENLPSEMMIIGDPSEPGPYKFIDDHTVAFNPYAGVRIVLSSKQRFNTPMRGSVGYRDIAFEEVRFKKDEFD